MFSRRLRLNYSDNPLFKMLKAKKSSGEKVLDLTESNPTRAGFNYRAKFVLTALSRPAVLQYEPDPRGLLPARRAISGYYLKHGKRVSPDSLFLTSSTSEAYSHLFKLLGNPGDEILVARPSYPLLEPLAELESLRLVSYSLIYKPRSGWKIDLGRLEASISTRTRAVVAVNPNNPTGSFLKKLELSGLNKLYLKHNLALVVDEVFLDYNSGRSAGMYSTAAGNKKALTFVLSGFSKILGLPQVKLSWIHVSGPGLLYREAADRLEYISDTYLSVGGSVQHAAQDLFREQDRIQKQILKRLERNSGFLEKQFKNFTGGKLLIREGGWNAVLEMDGGITDEKMALQLLERDNVLVHLVFFYDFSREGFLVLSLITVPEIFREGVLRIISRFS